jgi:hypothetical protein
LVFPSGAKFDDLAILFKEREMAWCHIVYVARFEDLVMIRISNPKAALENVAPMGTLAAIIGQTFKEGRGIQSGGELLKGHVHLTPFHLLAAHAVHIKRHW